MERGEVRPYLERGSCGEWRKKESLELSEAAKVLRYVRVYEKENEGRNGERQVVWQAHGPYNGGGKTGVTSSCRLAGSGGSVS